MNKRLKQWGFSLLSAGLVAISACGTLPGPMPYAPGAAQDVAANARYRTQKLLVMPDAGDEELVAAIRGAKESIDIEVYILSHRGLIPELAAAVQRGVQVRCLLEPEPYNPKDPNNPIPINNVTRKMLKDSGVIFRWTNKEQFTFTHQKSMVIDRKVAFIMTMNLSGTATQKNREFVLVERDPQRVAFVQRLFEADWTYQPFTETNLGPFVLSPINARSQIEGLIASAKKHITIQVEVFHDERIVNLLAQKAKEGVQIDVLLPDPKKIDFNLEVVAALRQRGVTSLRWMKSPFIHAKLVIADGARAYIGSINLTSNSMDKNRELGIILSDKSVVQTLVQVNARDWAHGQPFPAVGTVAGPMRRVNAPIDFEPAFY